MRIDKIKIYSAVIIIMGSAVVSYGLIFLNNLDNWMEFMYFILLAVLTESLSITTGNGMYISLGFAMGLAVMLIVHPVYVPVVLFVGTVFRIENVDGVRYHIFNSSLYKRVFNGSAYAICALLASSTYYYFSEFFHKVHFMGIDIIGVLLAIIIYVLANTVIYMILFSLIERKPIKETFDGYKWVVGNFFTIAPLGILMAAAYVNYGWFALLLFYGPLLLARYSFILYLEMKNVYLETIKALSSSVDAKDRYTNGHSQRVAHYALNIADRMELTTRQMENIKIAATLHDIGKIGIRDDILNKPGKLTVEEYAVIKEHPRIGANILDEVRFLKGVSDIILHHHERFDGKGYPDGISGDKIAIEDAILSIADTFDAVTTDRPYRAAKTADQAMGIILDESGKQFTPEVVEVFEKIMVDPVSRERFLNVD